MHKIELFEGKRLNDRVIAHGLQTLLQALGGLEFLRSSSLSMPQFGHEFFYKAEHLFRSCLQLVLGSRFCRWRDRR